MTTMTPGQEEHLLRVKNSFLKDVDKKYRLGQAEHKGNLWEEDGILDMALEEVIDLYVYLSTLKEQNEKREKN